jgi:hypothetical protein
MSYIELATETQSLLIQRSTQCTYHLFASLPYPLAEHSAAAAARAAAAYTSTNEVLQTAGQYRAHICNADDILPRLNTITEENNR